MEVDQGAEAELHTSKAEDGQIEKDTKNMTPSQEFASFLESEDHTTIPAQGEIQSQIVKKQMIYFEATKKRPDNLEKL